MIWASLYRAVFIVNLLRCFAERILLWNTANFSGDCPAVRARSRRRRGRGARSGRYCRLALRRAPEGHCRRRWAPLDRQVHLRAGHQACRTRRGRHLETRGHVRIADCGLRIAEAKLELRDSDSPIALIRRFERRGETRIPYISARTALDWQGDEGGYYTDIADVIRQISSKPVDDLHELWRRIVFTILVSNKDDHLKNHGFIHAGGDRWRLSPAFDINPSPSRHRVLETGIVQGGSFDASLDIALGACEFFDLTIADAEQHALQIADTIAKNWKQILRGEGASSDEVRLYADAFEHIEADKALVKAR